MKPRDKNKITQRCITYTDSDTYTNRQHVYIIEHKTYIFDINFMSGVENVFENIYKKTVSNEKKFNNENTK